MSDFKVNNSSHGSESTFCRLLVIFYQKPSEVAVDDFVQVLSHDEHSQFPFVILALQSNAYLLSVLVQVHVIFCKIAYAE